MVIVSVLILVMLSCMFVMFIVIGLCCGVGIGFCVFVFFVSGRMLSSVSVVMIVFILLFFFRVVLFEFVVSLVLV